MIAGKLTIGGRDRTFTLRLPPAAAASEIPLVVVLHGNHPEASGAQMRECLGECLGRRVHRPDAGPVAVRAIAPDVVAVELEPAHVVLLDVMQERGAERIAPARCRRARPAR